MIKKIFFCVSIVFLSGTTLSMQSPLYTRIQAMMNVPRTQEETDHINAKEAAREARQRDKNNLLKSNSLAKKAANKKHNIYKINKYEKKELNLLKFFEEIETRRELVTAFIAVLEIVRTEGVKLMQDKTFGDIILRKS